MIKINKPAQVPITLRRRGITETQNYCNEVENNIPDFLSGRIKLAKAVSTVYGSDSVKRALINCHNGKCCYCERKRDRVEIDIEHYRPKHAFTENREDTVKQYPGYYWLAYNWENLFLSCKECNITWKKNSFPLSNPRSRSRWHDDNNIIENEEPLLVNPSDEPREHIRFNNDAPYPKTKEGQVTIEELGFLDSERVKLREARLEVFKNLKCYYNIVTGLTSAEEAGKTDLVEYIKNQFNVEEAKEYLKNAVLPTSEFSSMAKDFLSEYFENNNF